MEMRFSPLTLSLTKQNFCPSYLSLPGDLQTSARSVLQDFETKLFSKRFKQNVKKILTGYSVLNLDAVL